MQHDDGWRFLDFMRAHGWIVAAYGAIVSTWVAWVGWRRDHSRFTVEVEYPPSYKNDPMVVTAIYRGGPAIRIKQCRARLVRVSKYSWIETAPQTPRGKADESVLRPEHREVVMHIARDYIDRIWFLRVEAEGGLRTHKFLKLLPPIWRSKMDVTLLSAAQHGLVVGSHKPLERALNAAAAELEKEARDKRDS